MYLLTYANMLWKKRKISRLELSHHHQKLICSQLFFVCTKKIRSCAVDQLLTYNCCTEIYLSLFHRFTFVLTTDKKKFDICGGAREALGPEMAWPFLKRTTETVKFIPVQKIISNGLEIQSRGFSVIFQVMPNHIQAHPDLNVTKAEVFSIFPFIVAFTEVVSDVINSKFFRHT